jgi:GntP family gluconate:H+ symporter
MMTLFFLLIVIVFIIVSTSKFKLHPFLTLLLAAIAMGFAGGLDLNGIITGITEGFGNTLKSIGIVIACGTIIGTFLEKSGGARTMAATVLRLVGEKNSPLAMSITGYIVSVPVFCDSGFVILSTLNKAISRRTGISMVTLAVALSTGLLTTHVFVPPTPGPLAAAAALEADIGLIILLGLLVSIPAAGVGLLWAKVAGRRFHLMPEKLDVKEMKTEKQPGSLMAFAPIVIPVILIALKSFADYPTAPFGDGFVRQFLAFIGNPVIALIIGVFIAFGLRTKQSKGTNFDWVMKGLMNAGVIILITGAGGAFGNILKTTGIGHTLGELMAGWKLGIFLPFVIAAVLKTAQGSSTVAIITTAALISPLLESLGLTSQMAKALAVLSIGAGSMTVSHLNDSYFWVVSQFSGMDTRTALRSHTLATLFQGLAGMLTIAILTWIFV